MSQRSNATFTAGVVRGSGRGRSLKTPTINLAMEDIPGDLPEGIYAATVSYDNRKRVPAALHYGPRPVFGDHPSCEVHLIDETVETPPETLTVEVVTRLRGIRDFASSEELQKQMEDDLAQVRGILGDA